MPMTPKPALTGETLRLALNKEVDSREALIEGFLYQRSILMVASDPGLGKSVVTIVALAQLSAGVPVFGALNVPKPRKCYYIPMERSAEESLERLKLLQNIIPVNFDNIFIDDQLIGINLLRDEHVDFTIMRIKEQCPNPDVVVIDPIYAAVGGGLSGDKEASAFCRFSARLQAELGCANWLNHHTHRKRYSTSDGRQIDEDDPFYGSQWLKAHCTAAYILKSSNKTEGGVVLENKKNSHGQLIKTIPLGFDPETYNVFAEHMEGSLNHWDRALAYARTCRATSKMFTFSDFLVALPGVSHAHARRLLMRHPLVDSIKKHKVLGKPTLYEICRSV